jgi:branched-chain amino acid aminotransferase
MVLTINHKFILNDNVENIQDSIFVFSSEDLIIYEVVRVIDGKILFLEDHIERFFSSFYLANLPPSLSKQELKERLHLLIKINNFESGNIKFQSVFRNAGNEPEFLAYIIPHYYPTKEQYNSGVSVTLYTVSRPEPNAKIQHCDLSEELKRIIEKENVFEVIMLHPEGNITEGSKSNLFMIKNNEIFTAPTADILPGITRKYVMEVCKNLNLSIHEKRVSREELFTMEALFLTGTSPKVLPIKNVNNVNFNAKHQLLRFIMKSYDELIARYLEFYPNI